MPTSEPGPTPRRAPLTGVLGSLAPWAHWRLGLTGALGSLAPWAHWRLGLTGALGSLEPWAHWRLDWQPSAPPGRCPHCGYPLGLPGRLGVPGPRRRGPARRVKHVAPDGVARRLVRFHHGGLHVLAQAGHLAGDT